MTTDCEYCVALSTTPELEKQAQRFIHCFDSNPTLGQGAEYVKLVELLTTRVISFFLLEPSAMAGLNSMQMKIINVCASTAIKVSEMLTSKLFRKRSNDELVEVANYWKSIYVNFDNQGSFVYYTLDNALTAKFESVILGCRAGESMDSLDVVDILDQLIAGVMHHFFLVPTDLVHLSVVSKKMLNVGVDSVEKTIHAVINKVVKNLNSDQFKTFVEHYAVLLRQSSNERFDVYPRVG